MTSIAKFQRRKTARPAEIIAAALDEFAQKGFAGAKLDDIAARAGVSKGALYLYFETKEALFLAVARTAIAPNLRIILDAASAFDGSFAALVRAIVPRAAAVIGRGQTPAIVRMVIGEARAFPELARIWHDDVVGPALATLGGLIAKAQARGEVRAGAPRLLAFSVMGPVLMGALFQEVFNDVLNEAVDLTALADQHVEVVLSGLLSRGD